MRGGSVDRPPAEGKAAHQLIDHLLGGVVGMGGEVGVLGGGQNGVVTEDLLYLKQIDTGLDQMSCIGVA